MLYSVRVEPLRPDVKEAELRQLLGDFGDIHRVSIVKASKNARYNRISKKKDIFEDTYANVSYSDSRAVRMAVANFDNKLVHPISRKQYEIVATVLMGRMQVRRPLRVREHPTQN